MRAVVFPGALFASFPAPASATRLRREQWQRFSADEQAIIRRYFGDSDQCKASDGGAEDLAPGAALVPGTPKRLLPEALEAQLPELDPDFDRVIVRGRVLLLEVEGELIHDVIPGLRVA